MNLYDDDLKLVTFSGQQWLGNFFGLDSKKSLYNTVFSPYFKDQSAILLLGDTPRVFENEVVIEHFSDHPHHHYQENDHITITSGFNFKNYPHTFKKNKIFYFPYWLFFSKFAQLDDIYGFPEQRKYSVSCLNRNIRIPRIYNLISLHKRSYFKEICWTFNKIITTNELNNSLIPFNFEKINIEIEPNLTYENFQDNHSNESIFYKIRKYHGQQALETFKEVIQQVPDVRSNSMDEYYHCARVYEPGWGNSYLNLVTEPQLEDYGFISEKIFKPIRAEQLFIVQGCPGTIQYLRSVGFDVFDDYIDHNRYDNEQDWIKRIDLSLEVLDEIYKDIPSIFAATKQRRLYNKQHLQSQELESIVLKDILSCMESEFQRKQNGI